MTARIEWTEEIVCDEKDGHFWHFSASGPMASKGWIPVELQRLYNGGFTSPQQAWVEFAPLMSKFNALGAEIKNHRGSMSITINQWSFKTSHQGLKEVHETTTIEMCLKGRGRVGRVQTSEEEA